MTVAVEIGAYETRRAIAERLRSYNVVHGEAPTKPYEFVVTLRDDAGRLIGGMTCDIYLGGLFVEWAWIEEAHRGTGHGSKLIAAAESHGLSRGASFVHLDTFSFQARGFYERQGYQVFGVLPYPNGVERFYMRKLLSR